MTLSQDCIQPFLFERLDIRGALVTLDGTWQGLIERRGYPQIVLRVLGEMSAVTALISANLKQSGRMTFQLRGEGPINLLVLDCDQQLRMRGMARWNPDTLDPEAPAHMLLGDGHLLLSLDAEGMRQPYQSLVPLEGDSIAAIFESYLTRSEQQPTRLALAADGSRAAGLFLQKMPSADRKDPDGWTRIQHLAATLRPSELLGHPPLAMLRRLFPEEDLRVFDPRPVSHHCPEDWEKIHGMLQSLGRAECDAILLEKGEILVKDDICNREYRLDGASVAALFEPPSHTVH